jgi:hypothetical protein
MSQLNTAKKMDVPSEHWDRLFAPSACLVMITTVDGEGRVGILRHLRARVSRSGVYRIHGRSDEGHLQ